MVGRARYVIPVADGPTRQDILHQQILDAITQIVGEHCHGWVFAAEVDNPTPESPDGTRTISAFDGGLNRAMGLHRRLGRRLDSLDGMAGESDLPDPPDTPEFV